MQYKMNRNEKSRSISTIVPNIHINKKEYSLNNSCFDPFSRSPPNEFMIKLKKRINNHSLGICNNNRVNA